MYYELESEIVARRGCAAISSLASKHTANQTKLSSACNFLADILTAHRNSADVVCECSRAISVMCHAHISNRNKFGASEACELVPQMLVMYIKTPRVCEWTIRAIADLAANNPNNQTKLGASGACEALVMLLKNLVPGSSTSSLSSSIATSMTAAASSKAASTTMGGAEGGGGGDGGEDSVFFPADAVVSECFLEAETEALVKWCFWALGNLIQLGKGAAMLIDEGKKGTPRIYSNSNSSNGSSSNGGSGGSGVGSGAMKNTARLSKAGAAEVVVFVLRRFSLSPVVAQWGARALNNMGKSRSLVGELREAGAVEVLMLVQTSHRDVRSVSEWVKLALETFASTST